MIRHAATGHTATSHTTTSHTTTSTEGRTMSLMTEALARDRMREIHRDAERVRRTAFIRKQRLQARRTR